MTVTKVCDVCNKSALSLLLLRPSPISKQKELIPPGSHTVSSDDVLSPSVLPARKPTESRFVLRLLRAGYVHVYIPSPPPGVKQWLVYRVTDNADLVPADSSLFSQPLDKITCARADHNVTGMKLLSIPQAHKINDVWIAYSANLWNDKLKKNNKANPEVMQHIQLALGALNTFAPTVGNLKAKVLECSLSTLNIDKFVGHDFKFNSVSSQVEKLAENLTRAAACHPKTKGRELAVVLRDPVGIAAELNALRLFRHELAKREAEKPENVHAVFSSHTLMALKKSMFDANQLESYQKVSPLLTKAKFDAETWPAGTEWKAITQQEKTALIASASKSWATIGYKKYFEKNIMGRVVYPDHEERAYTWAKKQTEENWAQMTPHFDDAARINWLKKFDERMRKLHYDPLAKFEEDWRAAADDKSTLSYFRGHFDPEDPNDPIKAHSSGETYARENNYINVPEPYTQGSTLDKYLSQFDQPIVHPDAVMARSLVGNQQSLINLVHNQLVGDSGREGDEGGMRDKMYDFSKGLRDAIESSHKYSWMSNSLALFGIGQLSALTGAAFHASEKAFGLPTKALQRLQTLQYFWGIRQAIDMVAIHGALHGPAPNMPVLITMRVDIDTALQIWNARRGQPTGISKSQLKQYRRAGGRVPIVLLTDTESVRAAQGNLQTIAKDRNVGNVKMGNRAGGAALAAAGSTVTLTEQQFLDLNIRQATLGSKAINGVRQSLAEGIAKDIKNITMEFDGRLGLGSLVVQAIGLYYGIVAYQKAQGAGDATGMRDAIYGISDSAGGTFSALMELGSVVVSGRIMAGAANEAAGRAAASRSMSLGGIRLAAGIAGVAGGVINALANRAKADDAQAIGDKDIANLYRGAEFMFIGIFIASGTSLVGTGAQILAARSIGGTAVEAIAIRFGAGGTASLLGISVSGWGLVLLGAGMAFQLVAIALTPTPIQRWIERSYFGRNSNFFSFSGKRDDMFPKGSWRAEEEGLKAVLEEAKK